MFPRGNSLRRAFQQSRRQTRHHWQTADIYLHTLALLWAVEWLRSVTYMQGFPLQLLSRTSDLGEPLSLTSNS